MGILIIFLLILCAWRIVWKKSKDAFFHKKIDIFKEYTF